VSDVELANASTFTCALIRTANQRLTSGEDFVADYVDSAVSSGMAPSDAELILGIQGRTICADEWGELVGRR
jgi:hypothetical protein